MQKLNLLRWLLINIIIIIPQDNWLKVNHALSSEQNFSSGFVVSKNISELIT